MCEATFDTDFRKFRLYFLFLVTLKSLLFCNIFISHFSLTYLMVIISKIPHLLLNFEELLSDIISAWLGDQKSTWKIHSQTIAQSSCWLAFYLPGFSLSTLVIIYSSTIWVFEYHTRANSFDEVCLFDTHFRLQK